MSLHANRQDHRSGRRANLLLGDLRALTLVDPLDDVVRVLAVNLAADRLRGAKNLQDRALKLLGQRAWPHDLGDPDDLVKGNAPAVHNCRARAPQRLSQPTRETRWAEVLHAAQRLQVPSAAITTADRPIGPAHPERTRQGKAARRGTHCS
jgi:hypothetical protein